MTTDSTFTRQLGIQHPIICGAMYPCSNPELVAAASEAGGIGIVQPMSLTYVHGYDFQQGLRHIQQLTDKPIGLNLILEKSSSVYEKRTREWFDIAIDEGVGFFVTALGNPRWVVDIAHQSGLVVYHDVTSRQWAEKALDGGVDGFICVNNRAGGHAGTLTPEALFEEISPLGKPVICAGGIGNAEQLKAMLDIGYSGAQLGTRFIASDECSAHSDYKNAVVKASDSDIVLTEKISGVPVSVINTPYIQALGTKAGPITRRLLRGRKTKHWMRMIYTLISVWKLKKSNAQGSNYKDYFQAGKSVAGIVTVKTVNEIIEELTGSK